MLEKVTVEKTQAEVVGTPQESRTLTPPEAMKEACNLRRQADDLDRLSVESCMGQVQHLTRAMWAHQQALIKAGLLELEDGGDGGEEESSGEEATQEEGVPS